MKYKYYTSLPVEKEIKHGDKIKQINIMLLACKSSKEVLIYLMILKDNFKTFSRNLENKEISTRYGGDAHNFIKLPNLDNREPVREYIKELDNNNFLAPLNLEALEIQYLETTLYSNIKENKEYETAINEEIQDHKIAGIHKTKIIRSIDFYRTGLFQPYIDELEAKEREHKEIEEYEPENKALYLTSPAVSTSQGLSFYLLYNSDVQKLRIVALDYRDRVEQVADLEDIKSLNLTYEDENELSSIIKNMLIGEAGIETDLMTQEVPEITHQLAKNLFNIANGTEPNYLEDPKVLDLHYLKKQIIDYEALILDGAKAQALEDLKGRLETRKNIEENGLYLADFLNRYENVILSINVNAPYKLNPLNSCYEPIIIDEFIKYLGGLFGKNLTSERHLKTAFSAISDRIPPTADTVQFKNCLYSMLEHKPTKADEPIICSVVSPFNYDPEAPSKAKGIINDFLMSSMHKPDPEDPSNEAKAKEYTRQRVQGLKEIIGYSFTSGNKYNILPVVVGISGGGKSVLGSIISEIFNNNVCDVSLQAMGLKDPERQAKACEPLGHSYINLIQDSSDAPIYDNSIIKKVAGNDSIAIKKLYKDITMLQAPEIPKTWLICNILPEFKNLELAIIERLFIIDFLVKFRGTDKQDPDLLDKILNRGKYKGEYPHEIEAFIFECLEAYRLKEESGADFLLKPTEDETKSLYLKFNNPMNYLINKLILKFDPLADSEAEDYEEGRNKTLDNYITVDELKEALTILETKEGVNLKRNSKDELITKHITASLFDIVDGVEEYTDNKSRKYTPKRKRIGDERVYIYPDLVKDPDTWEIVEKEKEKQDKE